MAPDCGKQPVFQRWRWQKAYLAATVALAPRAEPQREEATDRRDSTSVVYKPRPSERAVQGPPQEDAR